MNLEEITSQVVQVVREVSGFIQTEARSFDLKRIEYKDVNNLVSYVDKEAERMLVRELREIVPEAGFITEEGTAGAPGDPQALNWIIDPLDGTTNFIHGLPVYCVSVGLAQGQDSVLGVIHEPNLDEMFYGWQNGGAWCNGNPIKVSPVPALADSLLATGFPYSLQDKHELYLEIFGVLTRKTHGIRRLGAAAVDLAYVAAGRFEGFYEYNLHAWDMAAGVLLVQEAGGKVTDFNGGSDYLFTGEIIAAAGAHPELLEIIQGYFK